MNRISEIYPIDDDMDNAFKDKIERTYVTGNDLLEKIGADLICHMKLTHKVYPKKVLILPTLL